MSAPMSLNAVEIAPDYQIPSYFHLLKSLDAIYASGMFCHIAKPGRKRDQQLRLVWAVEQMLSKLQEVREENLQLRSPFFHAKRSAKRKISSQFKTVEGEIPLDDRLARETKLYKQARERLRRGKPLRFVPDYDNLTKVHRQLSASLQFFCTAMCWTRMPKWRKPYLDFEWAPPTPTPTSSSTSLPPAQSVDDATFGSRDAQVVKTPKLKRADSERPSVADSEATLVSDPPADKGPLESSWSTRSFSLIQSLCSFISDPGNLSVAV
ncbi:hypothetical protein BJ322DRAFT_721274 [Thelephora terrestris]|uniref:Uncharacterized protein n=1 Tax=Thelephora terrestris TaxID=56493 RepID=A0A9P6L849_9AGAM|nr:hypothetical protein BJ322DRAFT_721274 [Thelephora terrestris]